MTQAGSDCFELWLKTTEEEEAALASLAAAYEKDILLCKSIFDKTQNQATNTESSVLTFRFSFTSAPKSQKLLYECHVRSR